jgi:quercetin dioxygenase-like cupin family protein
MSSTVEVGRLVNKVLSARDQPVWSVLGTLLQFVSTPEQNRANLSVMLGGVPARAVVPLHSHTDPEVFYLLQGSLEVFQDNGTHSSWQTAKPGDVVTIAGGVKHALRNPGEIAVSTILVTQEQVYRFFLELGEPLNPGASPAVPTPEVMQHLFEVAARYGYWIGSPSENAAIGISLG